MVAWVVPRPGGGERQKEASENAWFCGALGGVVMPAM